MKGFFVFLLLLAFSITSAGQNVWETGFGSEIRFYQPTDFGILVVGTDRSLTAVSGDSGNVVWAKNSRKLRETSVVPVPGTDLLLLSRDRGKRSQLEALDIFTGHTVWSGDKVKGDVLQLAVDPELNVVAVTIVKDANGKVGDDLKREPVIYAFRLSDGRQLWRSELESEVPLMPSRFDKGGEIPFTLDNYRAPLLLDGRLYVFYEGVTSFRASDGRDKRREEFGVNEGGLALTDADPVLDDRNLYLSGRGKIRAVDRQTGEIIWTAKDLGVTPEMMVYGSTLFVRTGGRFVRIRDGKIRKRGPFGLSAIDTRNGKRLWRFKGADKGLTNAVFADAGTILIADSDDVIAIDAATGKKLNKAKHNVTDAGFIFINDRGAAVIGGRDTISAFRISDVKRQKGDLRPVWTARHKAPARGILRVMTGIALRATAIYLRYGGLANSAISVLQGAGVARSALSLRWSGLKTRFSSFDLTTIASNYGRSYVGERIRLFGTASRNPDLLRNLKGLQIITGGPDGIRGKIIRGTARRAAPSRGDVRESLLDRLDPVSRLERLSDYFLRRKRLAAFRGDHMYFYTDLPKPFGRKGLAGVNVHTGTDSRYVLVSNPDARFIADEVNGLIYSAKGKRLRAYDVLKLR